MGRPTGEEVNSELKELMLDPQGHTDCLTSLQKMTWFKKKNVLPIGSLESQYSLESWEVHYRLRTRWGWEGLRHQKIEDI